ncbi:MAG: HAD-IA family hydrolase, partial [Treponema sp.]|nr:HAD-IA family hydrolase [Treponema sp.]
GYRGYQTGILHLDENFHQNIKGALEQNLDIGVYVFSQAINEEEALEEAELVIKELENYKITLPVVFDPEIYLKAASSLGLSPSECVAIDDSPNGVRSAFNAGIKCIMVPDLISADDEMREKAWKIFKNLKEAADFLTQGA